jgi:hypothetical protein
MWIIFDLLSGLAQWIWKLWNRLPEKAKREIIEAIIQAMGELLRAFYRSHKSKGGK